MEFTESFFRSICDLVPAAIIAVSSKGKILYANNSFCLLLGYKPEEIKKISLSSLSSKALDDPENEGTTGFDSIRNGVSFVEYIKKDGTSVKLSCNPLKNFETEGKLDCQIVHVTEIDHLIKEVVLPLEEETSKIKSSLFEAVLDSFPDVIYIKNKKSQFININKAVVERFKANSAAEIIGKTDFDFFTDEHASQAFKDEQKIIKTGKPIINFEEIETWPDGSITHLSTSKMPLKNQAGEIIGTFGVSKDITEMKLHEQEIVEKTSILNAITSKMPVVIYKYKKSKGLSSLSGDKDIIEAFEESKVAKLKVSDSLSHFVSKLGSQKDKHGYFSFSSTSHFRDRDWHFENFIFEGSLEHGEFLGLALDITDRKQTEQRLKRDAKDLEKINKELNQFAYIISHDLKAPLRAITNLSEWIQEDLSDFDNDEVKENFKLLRGRVGRMENLINGILVYSRLSRAAINYEIVDSGKIIDEVLDYLMVPKKFKITKSKSFPILYFSKVHLEQIFSNLISNAVKHHDKESGQIKITHKEREDFYEFSVSDDGPGIKREYHEKVFKIFQTLQARDSFESTGIGLTIVKKLIEEQGGAVKIDSEEGKGSKFIFTIPKLESKTVENKKS